MMENVASKDGCIDIDLEMGGNCDIPSLSNVMKQVNYESSNVVINKVEERVSTPVAAASGGDDVENGRLMVIMEESNGGGGVPEKKVVKERPKAMSAKKPPKPPRAPRGLSLDSSDQKLIRELHELAKLKRARIERMKAVKKAKESKVASSKNQLFATLLTVLFCLVVLFQGISSRTSSATSFQGSPISTGFTERSIISVQHNPIPISWASNVDGPGSESSSTLVEHTSGVDTAEQAEKVSKAVR